MTERPATPIPLALLALSFTGLPGLAQDDPFDRGIEEAERMAPRPPGEVEAFSPRQPDRTFPVRPGLTAGQDWAAMLDGEWPGALAPSLLAERTFLNQVRGMIIPGPEDTRIFVPSPVPASPGEGGFSDDPAPTRAMLLLPSVVLDRFSTFVMTDDTPTPAIVSGQVFLYNNRNYLMPGAIRAAAALTPPPTPSESAVADTPPDPPASDPGRIDPGTIADDPDVAGLIAELEKRPPFPRPSTRPADSAPPSGGREEAEAPFAPPPEDGSYFAGRRGRMVRSAQGAWLFVTDNDDPGRPPRVYTLLPCRTLEELERVALREGDASAGLVSGRVYRFRDQWFLLPTIYQQERRGGVDPLQ
jgi:hypothetical protein